jgi:hypothetical protein
LNFVVSLWNHPVLLGTHTMFYCQSVAHDLIRNKQHACLGTNNMQLLKSSKSQSDFGAQEVRVGPDITFLKWSTSRVLRSKSTLYL